MSETTSRPPRSAAACPHCGAARAPEVAWCTRCFAVLDAPGPVAGQGPAAAQAPDFALSAWDLAQRETAAARDGGPQPDPGLDLSPEPRGGHPLFTRAVALGGTTAGKLTIIIGGTVLLLGLFLGGLSLVGLLL